MMKALISLGFLIILFKNFVHIYFVRATTQLLDGGNFKPLICYSNE